LMLPTAIWPTNPPSANSYNPFGLKLPDWEEGVDRILQQICQPHRSQGTAFLSHRNNGLQNDKLRNPHKKICQTALARGLSASGLRPFLIGTKTKATPPNLPFSPRGTSCGASEEPIARLNVLPPEKGGWGGCLLSKNGNKPTENAVNYPANLFLANAFRPRGEYLLKLNSNNLAQVNV
jgi:hypothetical protein